MTADEVRRDLKAIRRLSNRISVLMECKRLNEVKLKELMSDPAGNEEPIREIEGILSMLDIMGQIRSYSSLLSRYMTAIARLPMTEQTLIVDGYLNGTPYWRIAQKMGYSVDWVNHEMCDIIRGIAKEGL